jgi:hypothetical protein
LGFTAFAAHLVIGRDLPGIPDTTVPGVISERLNRGSEPSR